MKFQHIYVKNINTNVVALIYSKKQGEIRSNRNRRCGFGNSEFLGVNSRTELLKSIIKSSGVIIVTILVAELSNKLFFTILHKSIPKPILIGVEEEVSNHGAPLVPIGMPTVSEEQSTKHYIYIIIIILFLKTR